MPQLINQSKNLQIATNVVEARKFSERLVGLLGKSSLPDKQTLWIHRCNSIHTFFMRFAIDVIFVDKNMRVRRVIRDIKPWRITSIVWGASSVFELPSGTLDKLSIDRGDQLDVCS